MPVTTIDAELLEFPRRGRRRLKFIVSITDAKTGRKLACSAATLVYNNKSRGYIDAAENTKLAENQINRLADVLENGGGRKIDVKSACRQIAESATIWQRYQAMEHLLNTAGQTGTVQKRHSDMLIQIAELLDIDKDKFLAMTQKILPVTDIEIEDTEFILGIAPDMTVDEQLDRLNDEYRKWNGRVTNSQADTRTQADKMLSLIAQARAKYVEQTC